MKFSMLPYVINMDLIPKPFVQIREGTSTFEVMAQGPIWPLLSLSLTLTLMLVFLLVYQPDLPTYLGVFDDASCSSLHHYTGPLTLADLSTLICCHYTVCTSGVFKYYCDTTLASREENIKYFCSVVLWCLDIILHFIPLRITSLWHARPQHSLDFLYKLTFIFGFCVESLWTFFWALSLVLAYFGQHQWDFFVSCLYLKIMC